MRRFVATVCSGLIVLAAGAVPAAAQPGGPCSLISDDALSQALGASAHAMGLISNSAAASSGQATVADMCVAQLGGNNSLMITHTVSVQAPGDASAALSIAQSGAFGGAAVDPALLSTTLISGLGDTAVLLSGTKDGSTYGVLVVWRGSEGYTLIGSGLADPQTNLTGVAQAILNGGVSQ
jgi:hypothetical protein